MARAYLSICAIYRDEAPYLREWVEFHRLMGVERFYLYDNSSKDGHREALAPYLEDGIVDIQDWPLAPGDQQVPAYEHCLREHGDQSRWIAFVDLDEFLFSPTGLILPELLTEYEAWPGVCVNVLMFGTSGHRTKPSGLVIENYVRRTNHPDLNRLVKSIVDPRRTVSCDGVGNCFLYSDGLAVDENRQPVEGPRSSSVSVSRLRINHYLMKSKEEWFRKLRRRRADGLYWTSTEEHKQMWRRSMRSAMGFDTFEARHNEEFDGTILSHLPALREALEQRDSSGRAG